MYTHTLNCSVGQYSAIPYTQNMHMEWKTVTGNPQVTRKFLKMQKCAANATSAQSLRFGPRWRPVTFTYLLVMDAVWNLHTKRCGFNKKTRWNSTGCRRWLCLRFLWPWPLTFWPQNLTSTSMNPNTSVTKLGWNSLHWCLRYGVTNFSGLTDSLMDGQTRIQYTFATAFQRWRRLKNLLEWPTFLGERTCECWFLSIGPLHTAGLSHRPQRAWYLWQVTRGSKRPACVVRCCRCSLCGWWRCRYRRPRSDVQHCVGGWRTGRVDVV